MTKRRKANDAKRQLTPRQAAFVRNLASGATITQAARNAGYSGKNLAQSGHQALKTVKLKMPELLDESGLSSRVLIEKYLVPLLSATTTKYFHYKGKIIYSRAFPDNRTRLMALDMGVTPPVGQTGKGLGVRHAIVAA